MSKLACLLFAVAVLSGCAGMNPQTRDEFRQALTGGVPFGMVDTYVANRSFEDVVNTLKQKAEECLNVDKTMQRREGGMTTMRTKEEYRTAIRVVNSNLAEMTTQWQWRGVIILQKVPEGGFYSLAVDIERVPSSKTKLTFYGSSFGGKSVWTAIKQWSDGQLVPCPS
jgi:hypothetical protein